jgi:hypothetical protein
MLRDLLPHTSETPSGVPDEETYTRYREASKALVEKVMEASMDRNAIDRAGRELGIMSPEGVLMFDSEEDMTVLMDYTLHECRYKGKNAFERYHEQVGGDSIASDDLEREILAARVASSTSLFSTASVSPETNSLQLEDLVQKGRIITLVDIGLSHSLTQRVILFLRPITFESGWSASSGVSFSFPWKLDRELLRVWRIRGRGLREHASARRFAALFRLSKTKGYETLYR